jgi:Flp pilus assembly protein TadD
LNLLKHGFMVFAWVADRFQYLASAGLIVLIAAGAARLGLLTLGRWRTMVAAGLPLLLLGSLTWRQSGFYRDYVTLFRHNVEAYPESWAAHVQLSTALTQVGQMDEAIAELDATIRLRPDKLHTFFMGKALLQSRAGRAAEAGQSFAAALALGPEDPEVHLAFAGFLAGAGETDRAATHYLRALRSRPHDPGTLNDLGCLLWKKGRREEARAYLRRAVALRPEEPAFRANLEAATYPNE